MLHSRDWALCETMRGGGTWQVSGADLLVGVCLDSVCDWSEVAFVGLCQLVSLR